MTMPEAEAHINVRSEDEIQVMIDYFTDIPQPIPMMVCAETQVFTDEAKAEPNYTSNQRDYNYNPESPINPNSNSEIQVTLLPSHDGNRQSI